MQIDCLISSLIVALIINIQLVFEFYCLVLKWFPRNFLSNAESQYFAIFATSFAITYEHLKMCNYNSFSYGKNLDI